MAKKIRLERLQELMREEMSKMLIFEMKDPRIGFITITKVEMTSDYQYAKVFYTILGDEKARAVSRVALNQCKGLLQSEVSRRIRLRLTPAVSFEYDHSLDTRMRMEKLISDARASDVNPPKEESEEPDESEPTDT